MWKWASVVLVCFLLATNIWWLYTFLDQLGIQKYVELENYNNQKKIEALIPMAKDSVIGLSQKEAEELLRKINPDFEPFFKEGFVNGVGIALEINEDGFVDGLQ